MNEEKDVKKDAKSMTKTKKVNEIETPIKSGLKSKEDILIVSPLTLPPKSLTYFSFNKSSPIGARV